MADSNPSVVVVSTTTSTSQQQPSAASSFRQCLLVSTAALLVEAGFDASSKMALESLCEILQSFIVELGKSSRSHAEVASRTEPLSADVIMGLTSIGFPGTYNLVSRMREYAMRPNREAIDDPGIAPISKPPSMLHTGDRKKKNTAGTSGGGMNVIPDYLPDFPDSHSYIRTPTHKQPSHDDYASVREKAASQKRDVERALTRFIAKTCGKTHSLFKVNDTNLYPLISCDQTARLTASITGPGHETAPHSEVGTDLSSYTVPAYINALIFRDQIFEEDERDFLPRKRKGDEAEGTGKEQSVAKKKKKKKYKKKKKDDDEKDSESEEEDETQVENERKLEEARKEEQRKREEEERREREKNAAKEIDNPFLKPVRLPRCSMALMGTPIKKQ